MKNWKVEEVYLEPQSFDSTTPDVGEINAGLCRYTQGFTEALYGEKHWTQPELTPIPEDIAHAVGVGEVACPRCFRSDGGGSVPTLITGQDTGIEYVAQVRCGCTSLRLFEREWREVPAIWQDANLSALQPSNTHAAPQYMDMDRQDSAFREFRSNPGLSALLAGSLRLGKTLSMQCLQREALWRWSVHPAASELRSVFWTNALDLLNEISAMNSNPGKSPAPSVTPALIRKCASKGLPIALFINEIDKFAVSEAKTSALASLIDAVMEARGQIVASSNLTGKELIARWGPEYGNSIISRFAAPPNGQTIIFSTKPQHQKENSK